MIEAIIDIKTNGDKKYYGNGYDVRFFHKKITSYILLFYHYSRIFARIMKKAKSPCRKGAYFKQIQ